MSADKNNRVTRFDKMAKHKIAQTGQRSYLTRCLLVCSFI